MDNQIEREQQLFSLCIAEPSHEWERILEQHCDDTGLRERVRRLLVRHQTVLNEAAPLQMNERDPERIGPYRILQRLGEGGMGLVYAAEQREPVRRRVAVKVLRVGHNSREVLARFDAERQALSLMNHTHVARILDAGTTADHRPYIVMEYVPGEPITRYCTTRSLPLGKRLQLFRDVCEAIQHAHQKGIIHRDLKPSNILVMEENGRAVPKVIDFGIAKAVSQRLTDHTLETKVGSLLGTPDYMSPEQAELTPLDVDTRADVYALGAVLYHILTGVPPLELAGSGLSYSEMQHVIREQEPVAPSVKTRTENVRIARELDWITLKALEKDRNRRYVTAAAFGDDIERFLAGDVTEAGPRTLGYRAGKFIRKHVFGVSAVSGAFMLVMTFAALMTWQVQKTTMERDRANREADIARAVTRFTSSLFELASPQETGQPDISARALLDAGTQRLEQQIADEDTQVRAALYAAASKAYHGIGAHAEAERLAAKSVELYKEHGIQDAQSYAEALIELAHAKREDGQLEEAEALGRDALDVAIMTGDSATLARARVDLADTLRKRGNHAESAGLLEQVIRLEASALPIAIFADAHSLLGRVHIAQGKFDSAEEQLHIAMKLATQPDGTLSLAGEIAKSGLAHLYSTKGETERAIELRRELLAAAIERYGEEHVEVGTAWNNLAFSLLDVPDKYAEAEQALLKSLAIKERLIGNEHPQVLATKSNLAWLYGHTGRWQEARRLYADLVEKRTRLLGADHPDTANARGGLGRTLLETGDLEAAEDEIRRTIDALSIHFGNDHWRTSSAKRNLGLVHLRRGELEQAETLLQEVYDQLKTSLGEAHPETVRTKAAMDELARALSHRN